MKAVCCFLILPLYHAVAGIYACVPFCCNFVPLNRIFLSQTIHVYIFSWEPWYFTVLVVITPGLTTVTVEWHNETRYGAKIEIMIENLLYYRVSKSGANQGSRVIRSLTPAVTYTVTVTLIFQANGLHSSSILTRQNSTLPKIGKVILLSSLFCR